MMAQATAFHPGAAFVLRGKNLLDRRHERFRVPLRDRCSLPNAAVLGLKSVQIRIDDVAIAGRQAIIVVGQDMPAFAPGEIERPIRVQFVEPG